MTKYLLFKFVYFQNKSCIWMHWRYMHLQPNKLQTFWDLLKVKWVYFRSGETCSHFWYCQCSCCNRHASATKQTNFKNSLRST